MKLQLRILFFVCISAPLFSQIIIDNQDNVVIGTGIPDYKLTVQGRLNLSTISGENVFVGTESGFNILDGALRSIGLGSDALRSCCSQHVVPASFEKEN